MKTSASKVIGPAVFTQEIGPRRWNVEKAKERATKIARKKFKDTEIALTRLVCYGYPRLGILIELVDPKTKEKIDRIIVDVGSLKVVPLLVPEEDVEGITTWSMLDRIPHGEKQDRIKRWEADDGLLAFLKNGAQKAKIDIREKLSEKERREIDELLGKVIKKREILKNLDEQQGTDTNQPESGGFPWLPFKTLPLTLYGQEDNCWCAVATGQMILRYHNYYYEQDDIAVEMNTIPPAPAIRPNDCGTTNGNQVAAYESLSRNYLDATFDNAPTWAKARDEIKRDLPLKSGIRRHARACCGYSLFVYFLITTGTLIVYRNLLIHDPWPPNTNNNFCDPHGGEAKWEEWDSIVHTNYIYVRPCSGTMTCQD